MLEIKNLSYKVEDEGDSTKEIIDDLPDRLDPCILRNLFDLQKDLFAVFPSRQVLKSIFRRGAGR